MTSPTFLQSCWPFLYSYPIGSSSAGRFFPASYLRLGRGLAMGSERSVCRGNVGGRRETPPWISTELFGAAAPALQGGVRTDPPRCGSWDPAVFPPNRRECVQGRRTSLCRAPSAHRAACLRHRLRFCSFANRKPSVPDSKLPTLYASWTLSAASLSSQGSASESAQRQSRALKAALPAGHTALRRGRGCTRKSECGRGL